MKYTSVFDIVGPVSVGPSSSHTTGALLIGAAARKKFGKTPKKVDIHLYGSFARTYRGHGTDKAIIAGLLGFDIADAGVRSALEEANKQGLSFNFIEEDIKARLPNTAKIVIRDGDEEMVTIGVSIGGGRIEIVEEVS